MCIVILHIYKRNYLAGGLLGSLLIWFGEDGVFAGGDKVVGINEIFKNAFGFYHKMILKTL